MANIPTARSLTAAADLPTIPQLYTLGFVAPVEQDAVLATPSAKINSLVAVIRADITKLDVDAIVNAANKTLLGGGGVDGAIHRAAGPELLQECKTLEGCPTGEAKITDAYDLPCKKVIHTVGPVYSEAEAQDARQLLESCYSESLKRAVENNCRTIVFNCISTGIYGYPSGKAASVACRTTRKFLEGRHGTELDKVIFCLFEMKDVDAYKAALPKYFPPTEESATAGEAEG